MNLPLRARRGFVALAFADGLVALALATCLAGPATAAERATKSEHASHAAPRTRTGARPRPAANPWKRYAAPLARADSLARAGDVAGATGVIDSLTALATTREDPELRMVAALGRARLLVNTRRTDEADALLRTTLPLVRSLRDTTGLCRTSRYLARIEQVRGNAAAMRAGLQRALQLAVASANAEEEGWARIALASDAFDDSRVAAAGAEYRRALAALTRAGEVRGAMVARAGYARALQSLGRIEESRREHQRVMAQALALGDRFQEAETTANLGSLELTSGDPARAAPFLRRAMELYQAMHWTDRVLWAANALGIEYLDLGRLAEADSVFAEALPIAEKTPNLEMRTKVLGEVGDLRRAQGRMREALEFGRRAVAYGDSVSVSTSLDVLYSYVTTLKRAGRDAEAIPLLDAASARLGDRMDAAQRDRHALKRAIVLRRLGRAREALPTLRASGNRWRASAGAIDGAQTLEDLTDLARCYRDVGERDSARVWYRRIADRWDDWRRTTTDPLWREKYDDEALRFSSEYAAEILDPSRGAAPEARAREAFDALQRFRARTLSERVHDPKRGPGPTLTTIDALALQQRVLRPGEIFLDLHASPDTGFVFVLTRGDVRAYGLGPSATVVSRLRRMRELLDDASAASAGMLNDAARSLGATVFGPAAEAIRRSDRVLLAAGSLAQYPLGALVVPGDDGALLLGREFALVPSATLLAEARASRPRAAARTLLAVAQSADAAGRAIPGAEREASWLAARFASADVIAGGAAPSVAAVTARVAGYDVLHFAAHTRAGGDRPWQSGMQVARASAANPWLTADEIARLRVPARLCVLAGCASLGGEANVGETLEGLATAWLSAGVKTVVATQWAADDAATSELMHRFYERLARGERAASALRGAQLEVRGIPRFAQPHFWAGLVLVGDPDTTVPLRRRTESRILRVTTSR